MYLKLDLQELVSGKNNPSWFFVSSQEYSIKTMLWYQVLQADYINLL